MNIHYRRIEKEATIAIKPRALQDIHTHIYIYTYISHSLAPSDRPTVEWLHKFFLERFNKSTKSEQFIDLITEREGNEIRRQVREVHL
jgi:hypothetical protein